MLEKTSMEKNFFGVHYEKELPKANQSLEFRIDKLHVKWRDYDNSFNSWINKKDIVT